jgi:hypothetical protein
MKSRPSFLDIYCTYVNSAILAIGILDIFTMVLQEVLRTKRLAVQPGEGWSVMSSKQLFADIQVLRSGQDTCSLTAAWVVVLAHHNV